MASEKVNESRLADGEVRILRNRDKIAFTPLPLDRRLNPSHANFEYIECWSGNSHALEFVYTEYPLRGFAARLSPPGRVVRQSLAELDRIHKALHGVRLSRCVLTGKDRCTDV